jgi:head-tail adaptor
MATIKLTRRVMVQNLVIVADAGGGQARNWADFREVWAKIQWRQVSRDVENGETGLRNRAIVTLRWAPDLPDPMRLLTDQKTLNVLSQNRIKIGAGDYLQIECEDKF